MTTLEIECNVKLLLSSQSLEVTGFCSMTCKGPALLPKFMWIVSGISKKRKWFRDQHVNMSNWFLLFCFLVINVEFWMQLIICPFITRVLASLWVQPETGRVWNSSILHSPASSLHKSQGKVVRLLLKTQSQHSRRPGQGCWQQKLPVCHAMRMAGLPQPEQASVLTQSFQQPHCLAGCWDTGTSMYPD